VVKHPDAPIRCDIRASFAKALSAWRKKNNVPLRKIAAGPGISVSAVSSWEPGGRFPTGGHFQALVNHTGVTDRRLFCIMADKCAPANCLLAPFEQ
jgi:transcriptional regulator with XRE-family HTH domain